MKKIGLLGGMAWISTVEYYSELHRAVEGGVSHADRLHDKCFLEMSIESLDLRTALSYVGTEDNEGSWARFDDYHRGALLELQRAGVACAAIASNTPHSRLNSIVQGVDVPVIDMFAATAKEVAKRGLRQVLILGTPFTMRSSRFRRVLASHGVHAIDVTNEAAVSETFQLIGQLQRGSTQGAAKEIETIVSRLWSPSASGQPCVLLACTELPLAFQRSPQDIVFTSDAFTYINPTAIHIRAILECAREKS